MAGSEEGLHVIALAGVRRSSRKLKIAVNAFCTCLKGAASAVVGQDGLWHIAHYAEVAGANGQSATREACLENLREAIALILEHRREEPMRSVSPEAKQEFVVVG